MKLIALEMVTSNLLPSPRLLFQLSNFQEVSKRGKELLQGKVRGSQKLEKRVKSAARNAGWWRRRKRDAC